jgi:predicted phage terminase large subunit-like protein
MSSDFYRAVFPTRLSEGRQSVGYFKTTEGGSRRSTSVMGGITGKGANLIIIDDPIKGEDSQSEAKRSATNAAFYNTIYSRLNDKKNGAIVIIMQRLHVDDLVGYVTEKEDWDMLVLPALAEQDEHYDIRTPYGLLHVDRKEGEALHGSREPRDLLEGYKDKLSEYVFSAQFQQRPVPKDGGIIKPDWLNYYDVEPSDFDRIVQSWDTASKEGEGNSYNVCTTWGVAGKDYYLLDVYRHRGSFDRLKADAMRLAKRYQPTTIVIEAQATGVALISELRRSERFNVVAAPASSESKTVRLEAKIDRFSGGSVHLPRDAHWLKEYVNELTTFPASRYSDQVDSTVQALAEVSTGDDGSFDRAIRTMELLYDSGEPKKVRLKLPPDFGTLIGRDGHTVIPDGDGVIEVDQEAAGSLQQRDPRIERL